MRYITCPLCGRDVRADALGTDLNGHDVMAFHYEKDFKECHGSYLSLNQILGQAPARVDIQEVSQ